jgi:hypothetical protein
MDKRFIEHYADQAAKYDLEKHTKELRSISEILGEGYPEVNVDIDFLRHQFATDIGADMNERIKAADILFVEDRGWTKGSVGDLNKVSEGVLAPTETSSFILGGEGEESFSYGYCQAIYNTHKPVLTADIPEDHALDKDFERERQQLLDKARTSKPSSFKDMLTLQDEYDAMLDKHHAIRNEYFKQYFARALKVFLDNHLEYKQKRHLSVHAHYGEMHFPIAHDIQQLGRVNVHFPSRYRSVAQKTAFRKAYGYAVTDDARARSWLLEMLYGLDAYENKGKSDETNTRT